MCGRKSEIQRAIPRTSPPTTTLQLEWGGIGWVMRNNCATVQYITTHHHTLQYHNVSSCMEAKERAPQWKGDLTANAHLIQRAAD